ncbi:exosome complex component RRP40 [Pancytospora philotis]|nr:exosome complex component RRP40 [Pancytospora philotis]
MKFLRPPPPMHVQFVRNVYPGDAIAEAGQKCIGIVDGRAAVAGQLCRIENLYFVRSKTSRYSPTKFDVVIGKIFHTSADMYKVDLGGSAGHLPVLAFHNATKRNRPELQRGDVVLCSVERVVNGEPLLCCRKEGYGKIEDAFPLPSWKVRLLYFSDWLPRLGAKYSFKIALGMNGFVWVGGADPLTKRDVLKALQDFN